MKNISFLILFLLLLIQSDAQTTWFVQQSATGTGTGLSWENAFVDLREALAQASYGDQIWVAEGTYRPTSGTDRSFSFELPIGIGLFGGFAGSETLFAQRDVKNNPTILSGEIGDPNTMLDNSFHVLTIFGGDSLTVVDGFIIEKGRTEPANGQWPNIYGGGMLILADQQHPVSAPSIQNCHFERNYGAYGGAIACLGDEAFASVPNIRDCNFSKNYAVFFGGGIYKNGINQPGKDFVIYGCTFEKNFCEQIGGGVAVVNPSGRTVVSKSRFMQDSSKVEAGGMYFQTSRNARYLVDSCDFWGNYSRSNCGGLSHIYMGLHDTVELTVKNCHFLLNKTRDGVGSGMYSAAQSINLHKVTLSRVIFENNLSESGGAINIQAGGDANSDINVDRCYFLYNRNIGTGGPAFYYSANGVSGMKNRNTITNSVFALNDGAIGSFGGKPGTTDTRVVNCTFFRNGKLPFSKYWDANFDYVDYYMKMQIYNSIIWETDAPDQAWLFYNNDGTNFNIRDYEVDYSLVNFPDCSYAGFNPCGEHMIYGEYPMFVDTTVLTNYVFAKCSPAQDTGSNVIVDTFGLDMDIMGHPRIRYGRTDLGAYEIESPCVVSTEYEPLIAQYWLNSRVLSNPILFGESVRFEVFPQKDEKLLLQIFDLRGRECFRQSFEARGFSPQIVQVPTHNLVAGTYFARFVSSGGKTEIHKFLMTR